MSIFSRLKEITKNDWNIKYKGHYTLQNFFYWYATKKQLPFNEHILIHAFFYNETKEKAEELLIYFSKFCHQLEKDNVRIIYEKIVREK